MVHVLPNEISANDLRYSLSAGPYAVDWLMVAERQSSTAEREAAAQSLAEAIPGARSVEVSAHNPTNIRIAWEFDLQRIAAFGVQQQPLPHVPLPPLAPYVALAPADTVPPEVAAAPDIA